MADPDAPEQLIRSMRLMLRAGQALMVLAIFGFTFAWRVPRAVSMTLLIVGVALCGASILKLMQARKHQR